MKKFLFTIVACLVFSTSFAQLEHFLIGVYSHDYDSASLSYSAGTDPLIGNDTAFLKVFKEHNFNTIQIEYQLMPHYLNPHNYYIPHPVYATQLPSKSFLDRADSLNLRIILSCPDIYVDQRFTDEYNLNSSFSQYDSLKCLYGLNYYANHPAIQGFAISDEPHKKHFHDLASYCRQIKNYDDHLIRYVNVVPSHADLIRMGYSNNDTTDYVIYINEFVDSICPNILPIDIYPIKCHFDDTTNTWPRDFFFSLDVVSKKAEELGIPFLYIPTFIEKTPISDAITHTYIMKNIEEFNYVLFASLMYGAKGINYWHAGEMYSTWPRIDSLTKKHLKAFHNSLLKHEEILLSLHFKNAYHFSTASTLLNISEIIRSGSQIDGFNNDNFRHLIFASTSSIIPIAESSVDSLAVSFLTDNNGGVYFWVFNKSLVSTEQIQLNLKEDCSVVNILEDWRCPQNGPISIQLLPGEAKLFRTFFENENDSVLTDTRWRQPRVIHGDLVIDSLATLTVTDTLFCTPSSRIIVRPGGKLVVDGGVLTSACAGEMWPGIQLEGHSGQQQSAAYQGTVQLVNGAVVENALCGILTCNPSDSLHTTGGIVTADSATFRNCAKAVEYIPYANTNWAGLELDNQGAFTNCTFTVDDGNLFAANGTDFLAHVTMWDVKGVTFNHCRFEDARTGSHVRKSAISAMDAGFTVKNGCNYKYPLFQPDCDCYLTTGTYCSFTGFGTAINVGTSGSPYAVSIDGAHFSDNMTGVSISGNSHATVTRCTFDLSAPSGTNFRQATGLSLSGCTGYGVEENVFTRETSPSSSVYYGIRVNNSGTGANSLYRNTFERMSRGIFVSGTNGNGSNTGLQMTCNSFSDCVYDMYLSAATVVRPWQGDNNKGADNTFSGTQTSSLYSAGSQLVTYLHSAGSNHVPYAPTASYVTLSGNASANSCVSTICGINPMWPRLFPESVPLSPTPGFLALKQQYEDLLADFGRNGYAEVLEHADDNTYDAATVAAAENAALQLGAVATELYALSHEAVRALMNDTLEDVQAVYAWLDATPGLASRYLEAETEFALGSGTVGTHNVETVHAPSLQDIANHITTAEERDEYDNYVAFSALKEALQYDNGHVAWPYATDAQVGELIRIADANTGRASLLAKDVLCFFFGICYDDDTELRALAMDNNVETRHGTSLQGKTQNIIVQPNPTDGILHITATDGEITRVEMMDMFGRNVPVETHGRASLPSPTTTINTSALPSGVYILRVTLRDGAVRTTKVVKR